MSYVSDLRTTLLYALFGALLLSDGLLERAAGEPVEEWLISVVSGGLFCLSSPTASRDAGAAIRERVSRSPTPGRSLGASSGSPPCSRSACGRWQGHGLGTWGLLVAGGLLGVALLAHQYYGLEE